MGTSTSITSTTSTAFARTAAAALAATLVGTLALPASSASAAGDGQGELRSAFQNEINQFRNDPEADFELDRPEGHINPFIPTPAAVCDASVVGTWLSIVDFRSDELDRFSWGISLNGAPLDVEQTPTKSRKATGSRAGETVYGFTRGEPVIGKLEAGEHQLTYDFRVDGEFAGTFTRTIVSSPDHC